MNSELTETTDIKEERSVEQTGLETAPPCGGSFRGWILYDGACRSCTASARRFDKIFRRRGFLFLPLQTNWVIKRLALEPGAHLEEMCVLTSDGRDIGGADAVIFLARQIWWTRPFAVLARMSGMHRLLDRGYRWIAAHRGCNHLACDVKRRRLKKMAVWRPPLLESLRPWMALILFPFLALIARNRVAPWQFMWLMAGAIFLGCKWLTFSHARREIVHFRIGRALAYFLLWPGMDAEKFLHRPARKNLTALSRQVLNLPKSDSGETPNTTFVLTANEGRCGRMSDRAGSLWLGGSDDSERIPVLPFVSSIAEKWLPPHLCVNSTALSRQVFAFPFLASMARIFLGAVVLFGVARFANHSLLTGWIGMIGFVLILHFGLFHLLAIAWRAAGLDAEPIMEAPLSSKSVSEFWGRRWNGAFNRLALDFVFRPLACRRGTRIATLAAFLVSGLIHELVISLPASAGYGLPTAYFLLQGIGILTERALPQIRGQIFTIVIIAVPAFWLFHPPFVRNVILPFMKAIGAL